MDAIADIYPLTSAQSGLLVGFLTEPEPGLYVVQMRFALTGLLDRHRLELAWQTLTRRHDVLRTATTWERTSQPVNVVITKARMPIEWLDFTNVPAADRDHAVREFLEDDRQRGFDLEKPPLSRVTVISLSDRSWEMVWTHHHLILDGWSAARLMDELWGAYTDIPGAGQPPSFKTFASALAAHAERERNRHESYWRERLTGADQTITVDRPQAATVRDTWTDRQVTISDIAMERWRRAARRHQVTLSTMYHASWALTLRASGLGPDELVLGSVADTRGIEAQDVVGLCVASIPLRVTFADHPLGEWLRAIAVERATAQEHAALSLAEHRTWSKDHALVPFRYLLAVEGYPHASLIAPDAGSQLTVRYLGVRESTEYALTAGVPAGPPCLKLTVDTRRITTTDAEQLLILWASALDALANVASDDRLAAVLAQLPASAESPTLPGCISELARLRPSRPAFRDARSSLDLRGLDIGSTLIAHRLQEEGLQPGERVGVVMDGSIHVATATLGVIKAGGVVAAMDPRHPAPYRAAVAETAGVRLVLRSQAGPRPERDAARALSVPDILAAEPPSPPAAPRRVTAGDLAFLVYEAGSALNPKAAAHDNSSVVRTATEVGDLLGLGDDDDWLVTRPATGAMAPWEMWVAPLHGGCTVLGPGLQHHPLELRQAVSVSTVAVIGVTRDEAAKMLDVHDNARIRLVSAVRLASGTSVWSRPGPDEPLGQIEDLAQADELCTLKVNGIPVDPADIEAQILRFPWVESCSVRQGPDGALQATVERAAHDSPGDQQVSLRRLTRALRSSLPEGMVPQLAFAAAPVPDATRQHHVEEQVRRVLSQVLELPDISLDTPFFDLGGNSFLLFGVLKELKSLGWTNINLTDLFAHSTVRALSKRLTQPDSVPTYARAAGRRPAAASARRRRT
jgi:hypothetical protein